MFAHEALDISKHKIAEMPLNNSITKELEKKVYEAASERGDTHFSTELHVYANEELKNIHTYFKNKGYRVSISHYDGATTITLRWNKTVRQHIKDFILKRVLNK